MLEVKSIEMNLNVGNLHLRFRNFIIMKLFNLFLLMCNLNYYYSSFTTIKVGVFAVTFVEHILFKAMLFIHFTLQFVHLL